MSSHRLVSERDWILPPTKNTISGKISDLIAALTVCTSLLPDLISLSLPNNFVLI